MCVLVADGRHYDPSWKREKLCVPVDDGQRYDHSQRSGQNMFICMFPRLTRSDGCTVCFFAFGE